MVDAALDLYDNAAGRQEQLVLSHMAMVKRVAAASLSSTSP